MQTSRKSIVIATLIWAGFVPVCLARSAPSKAETQRPSAWDLLRKHRAGPRTSTGGSSESGMPTARELLNEYTDALNAVRSFIARKESVKKLDYAFDRNFPDRSMAGLKRRGQRQYSRGQARTDGKRFHWRAYSWGNLGPAHGDVDETQAHYNCDNWDGVTLYGHAGNVKVPGIVILCKPSTSQVAHPMSRKPPASYLVGYNMESDERMDSILRSARKVSVSSRMENVGGSDCYVIRANTDKGTLSLWIDPAHGYNLAKAEARLSEGDFAFDYRLKRGESRVTRLKNVRFEKVNGVWVPMEADVSQHRKYRGGTVNEDYHYRRTEFVLNPDHDALGSFDSPIENPKNDPELKNGTEVYRLGDPDQYIWQDGRVIDKTGKVIIGSQMKQLAEGQGGAPKAEKEMQEPTSVTNESAPKSSLPRERPSAWELLRKRRQEQVQAAAGGDKQRAPDHGKRGPPMAAELLDRCTQALDSFGSIVVKTEIASEFEWRYDKNWHEPVFRGRADKGVSYKRTEFRTDGRRIHSREYTWGHISRMDPSVPKERPFYNLLNYVNKQVYRHSAQTAPDARGLVLVYQRPDFTMRDLLAGYAIQSEERVDAILRRVESISVRPKTEPIGGSDCYAIDAETDSGRISVWIDPAHGYRLAKAQARGTEGDLYWGKPLPRGHVVSNCLENVRFEKVDGVWVAMEADISMENHYGRGSFSINKRHYKRTQILLNPDHDALGSFDNPLENPKNDPLLRNGTKVRITTDGDRKRYIWQDGKLIPDKDRRTSR